MISPAFYEVHKDIKKNKHTHYFLKGGRGSTKSSFAAVEMLISVMKDKNKNGVCVRRYGKSIKESVFNQLLSMGLTDCVSRTELQTHREVKSNEKEENFETSSNYSLLG